ncbi:hypothetical protein GCM10007978_12940 [Shewanella hanedai]|nr:winged helix-turn-helix domain-containing protein [Shewanella hanedai]GGI76701.1 hypothetical protein GCM10007978_12940 [Shewanella hanedai]
MYTRFDEFSINTKTFELMIGRELVQLDERVFLLFSLLIEHYPTHCSKQECLEYIWPDTVVSDMSLAKLVSDTRKLFKLAGCEVPIIQTIHGRGYRLSKELGQQLGSQGSQLEQLNPVISEPSLQLKESDTHEETTVQGELASWLNDDKTIILFGSLQLKRRNVIAVSLIFIFAAISVFSHLSPSWFTSSIHHSKELVYSQSPAAIGRILWVDDNPDNNIKERAALREHDIGVYITTSTEEALLLLSIYGYEMVISDMGRGEDPIAGLKLLRQIRESGGKIPYIIYTINDTQELNDEVRRSGGQGVAVDSENLHKLVMYHFQNK